MDQHIQVEAESTADAGVSTEGFAAEVVQVMGGMMNPENRAMLERLRNSGIRSTGEIARAEKRCRKRTLAALKRLESMGLVKREGSRMVVANGGASGFERESFLWRAVEPHERAPKPEYDWRATHSVFVQWGSLA